MPVLDTQSILANPLDRQILAELQERNQKHIERADEEYQELGVVRIFNVGPQSHIVSLGGLGLFTVPACPEGRIYSEPLPIWRMYPEGRNEDMNKMIETLTNGYAIAEGIVGYGKFSHPSSDLRRLGVFTAGAWVTIQAPGRHQEIILASEVKKFQKKARGAKVINTRKATPAAIEAARKNGDDRDRKEIEADILAAQLPTEDEITDAHERLNQRCSELVAEANDFFRNNLLLEIQSLHRWAATRTGQIDLPWVKTSLIMIKCQVCGNPILPDVAICLGCKSVVPGKEDVIKARRVPGYEWLWAPKPKAKAEKEAE